MNLYGAYGYDSRECDSSGRSGVVCEEDDVVSNGRVRMSISTQVPT